MGAIHGDLSILSLRQLLQALVLDGSSGLLSVASGLERRVLRVSPAGIRLVRGSRRCHRFERLLRGAPGDDTPSPFPNPEATARVMGEWMLDEICEVLTWTRGTYQFNPFFDPAQELEAGPFGDYAADCDVALVALRAARWADELPRVKAAIPDLRHVPVRTSAFAAPRTRAIDGEAMDDILRLVDGKRPVIQVLEQSVFPRFIVLRVLYQLTRDGVIRLEVPTRVALSAAA
jgi:hypothetical protein